MAIFISVYGLYLKFVHATEIRLLLGAGLQVVGPPAQPQEGRRGQHHDRHPRAEQGHGVRGRASQSFKAKEDVEFIMGGGEI